MITLDTEYLKKLEEQAVKERDEAYIDFVKTGNLTKIKAYSKKYDILMPKNKKAQKVGIYKAVQYCDNIPEDVKDKAKKECLELGYDPFISLSEAAYAIKTILKNL